MANATSKLASLPYFNDLNADALDTGNVYIGLPNTDPRQNPVTVYYDEAQTIPAVQPLRVLNGHVTRAGAPAEIFLNPPYSIYVENKRSEQVYYLANVLDPIVAAIGSLTAFVVPNIAALRVLDHTQHAIANVTSYYSTTGVPDGGGGLYLYDASDSTSVDNGGTVIVDSTAGRWKLYFTSAVSIKQFGAKVDAVTDDTAAWTSALANVSNIYVPVGTTCTTGGHTVRAGTRISGASESASIVNCTHVTNNVFTFGNGTPYTVGFTCTDLGFTSTVTKTAGVAFNLSGGDRTWIQRIYVEKLFGIAKVDNCGTTNFSDVFAVTITPTTGVFMDIGGNTTGITMLRVITDGGPGTQPAAGVRLYGPGDGLWMTDCQMNRAGVGFLLAPQGGQTFSHVFASNCTFDTCSSYGMSVANTGGVVRRLWLTGCWFGSNTLNAIEVDSALLDGLRLIGAKICNNGGNGILFNTTTVTDVQLSDCLITGNSLTSSGNSHGVTFQTGATINNLTINGCRIGAADQFSNTQGYAVVLGPTLTCNNLVMTGNDFTTNVSGPILVTGSTFNGRNITGNIGLVSETAGAVTILSGAGSINVNHGLSIPPAISDIMITPNSGWGGAATYSVSAINATNFTIGLSSVATSNVQFSWQAKAH